MRWTLLLLALLPAGTPNRSERDLCLIEELDLSVQARFLTPPSFGMSRMVRPSSLGQHFVPNFNTTRDFEPENEREKTTVARIEAEPLHVGFYLFGRAIDNSDANALNYRALKGPAAVTRGAPRPGWYPTGVNGKASADALPDWKTIYPVAQRAMRSFSKGGTGFETSVGSWRIAARPVLASQERCVTCHNEQVGSVGLPTVVPNQAVGGILYAFRRAD